MGRIIWGFRPKGEIEMAGKTQYKNAWQKDNVDRVNLTMPKGRKDEIKAHAAAQGESVNGFINRAIGHEMERDSGTAPEIAGKPTETAQGAGMVSLPSDTLEAAQRAAERTGETVIDFVACAVSEQQGRDDRSFKMGINPA